MLFPIANATEQVPGTNAFITTVVSSPILGTIVGSEQNFSNLTEPVRVLLQLQKKEVGDQDVCEKCLYVHFIVCVLAIIEPKYEGVTINICNSFLHRMSQVNLDVSLGISILQVWTQYWINLVTVLSYTRRFIAMHQIGT